MTNMPVTTSFPEFVPNQILTNTQLNELREYLDDQNRLTRVRLTGIGIICGLHANVDDSGNNLVVNITNGYGVTSDGYIIEIPDTKFVAKADYIDSYREEYTLKNDPNNEDEIGYDVYGPSYEPWRLEKDKINLIVPSGLEGDPPGNPVTQIAITELLTQDQADENADSSNISQADFTDHVLVLYLEIQKHDLKSCLTTDCNNKGQNLEFVVKALLIHEDELTPVEPCKDWSNPAFIPRFHRALRQNGVGTADLVSSTNDINGAYSKIVNDVKIPLFNKIQLSYNQVNHFLQLNIDMVDVQNTWDNALNFNIYNQYHYDFVKDIACAYNEFIAHYCKIVDNCCSLEDFPRHLMIRDFVGEPEPYRHEFQPSPVRNVMHHDLKKAELLFHRIIEMIQQFELQQLEIIKITPSQTDRHSLGEKAIPHYYKLQTGQPPTATKIKSVWQGEACCKDPSLLSYAENNMVSSDPADNNIDNAEYIEAPLEALIDKKGFFRIEGHLDQDCKTVMDTLADLRKTHNLDFNLQLLSLDDSEINISESDQIKEIKNLLKVAEFVRNEIEQHYFTANVLDPDFIKAKNDQLNDIWKDIERVKEKWLDIRCNTPLNCDLTQVRADYLIIRSRVICTYNKIKKVLGELPDLKIRDNGTNSSLGEVSNQLNKVRARRTELEANLNSEGLTKKKRSLIELEMAQIKSEHSRLVQVENIFKIGTRLSDNIKARNTESTLSSESATRAVAFNLTKSNLFTEGLRIGLINLKSDVEKMCAQLPKDGLKFNYCLFIYYYKNVIAGIIQLKLLAGVFLEYLVIGINQNPASSQVLPFYAVQLAAGYLAEITDYINAINRIQYNCFHAELATSYYTIEHLLSHRELTFGAFAKKHTGMEHLAGVTRGDTFILVCDEVNGSRQIVADFTLSSPVGCCCDLDPENLCLPPIALPDYKVIRFDERADQSFDINEIIDVISNDFNLNGNGNLILSLPSKKSAFNQLNNEPDNLTIVDQNGKQQVRYTQIYRSFALDSFRYQIHQEDDCKLMDEGEVIIFIRPESGTPLIVQSDIVATSEGQAIDIDVVKNDLHLGFLQNEAYTLTIPRQAGGLNGNISVITPSGQTRQFIKYVPSAGFVGRDNFEYEVKVAGKSSRGAVTVLVVPCCKDGTDNPDIINTGPTIIGTVTDFTGVALIGMNVVVNNNLGTTTDFDGRFALRDIPLGRQSLVFSFTGFKSQTFILNVSAGIPSATLNIILQESTITNPPSSVGPVGPVDMGHLIDLVLPGEVEAVDHSRVVLDTFSKRHAERVKNIEELRNDSVVGTTDAFAEADSFINNTMIDSSKTIKAITTEYKTLTKSLIDAHKLSRGESKKKYKGLIEKTTHAYMDKMIIKDPNKAEPTMQAELKKSIAKIKKEGISVVGFKQRFKGFELKSKMKINAIGEINKILK